MNVNGLYENKKYYLMALFMPKGNIQNLFYAVFIQAKSLEVLQRLSSDDFL